MDELIIMIGTIFIFLLFVAPTILYLEDKALDESCERLGMTREEIVETDYCVDSFNQAHYTLFDCNFLTTHCDARIVSIGNQRVITR